MDSQGTTEVHLLGFGEPESVSNEATVAYLERIFTANARLDDDLGPDQIRNRCRSLAERRAPGLLAAYERMGGSPMLEQCRRQAADLSAELARRGESVHVRLGMQFTEPTIEAIATDAVAAGARRIVALPLYPLCGLSTTFAALDSLHQALRSAAESAGIETPQVVELTGWHRHDSFIDAVALSVTRAVADADGSLTDGRTRLYFSAHGTPVQYLSEGPPYDQYVAEACALVAERLGVAEYELGYQNHSNRGIEWTAPSNEELLTQVDADRLIVVPVSFIHEQSETLDELDEDFVELARQYGMSVIRVPVPWAAKALVDALTDLVQPLLQGAPGDSPALRQCRCRASGSTSGSASDDAWCLN